MSDLPVSETAGLVERTEFVAYMDKPLSERLLTWEGGARACGLYDHANTLKEVLQVVGFFSEMRQALREMVNAADAMADDCNSRMCDAATAKAEQIIDQSAHIAKLADALAQAQGGEEQSSSSASLPSAAVGGPSTDLSTSLDWRPIETAPHDGKPIRVRVVTTYKWTPYKPDGQRQMNRKGRWQTIRSEYGGWTNEQPPEGSEWTPYPGRRSAADRAPMREDGQQKMNPNSTPTGLITTAEEPG